jgi:hypothetical protein
MLIRKDKITTGDDPHLPDEVKMRNRGRAVVGSYKICIAKDGAICSVDAISPIQGADENIVKALYGWRYKPQPLPICFLQSLSSALNNPCCTPAELGEGVTGTT